MYLTHAPISLQKNNPYIYKRVKTGSFSKANKQSELPIDPPAKQSKTKPKTLESDSFILEINQSDFIPERNLRFCLWNVNSLHVKLDRPEFLNYIQSNDFDFICLNETKYSAEKFKKMNVSENYFWAKTFNQYWSFSSEKKGYSGVCILSKFRAINVKIGFKEGPNNGEGRLITLEFDRFFLVCVYTICSGLNYKRIADRTSWDALFLDHLQQLNKIKPVIVAGDLNVAFSELDVYNVNKGADFPGFYPIERKGFHDLLANGFVDTWREKHSLEKAYTWWDVRTGGKAKNEGWRLDYYLVSKILLKNVVSVDIRQEILCSDHAPVELILKNTL